MTNRPVIFISATGDLRSARDLVRKVLYSMGFDPVRQDIAPVDGGELLEVLRKRLAPCAMMMMLVGQRYGAEPPRPTPEFGRGSYTQFEALEAERLGEKVIHHFLADSFPTAHPIEWATTQYNLGTAWVELLTRDKSANLKQAIAAYEAALTIVSQDAFPDYWSIVQSALNNAKQRLQSATSSK
jgi:hypothetical protein